MKKIMRYFWDRILTWVLISVWIIITILWVSAFESLTTTPWSTGNQSLGSQILSKLPSGGFNRSTDSLQAIRQKLDTLPTTWWWVRWAGYTTNSYNWNLWWLKWANIKCDTDYPWSHFASADEIMKLWNTYPWSASSWVSSGVKYLPSVVWFNSVNCNWYINNVYSGYSVSITVNTNWFAILYCNSSLKLACVY